MNCLIKLFNSITRRPGPAAEAPPAPTSRRGETHLAGERIQIERKQFFFDIKKNASGRFLRITEDVGGRRDTIIVPATGLQDFRDAIDRLIRTERRTR